MRLKLGEDMEPATSPQQIGAMICALSDNTLALIDVVKQNGDDVLDVLREINQGQQDMLDQGRALEQAGNDLREVVAKHEEVVRQQMEQMRARD